MTDPVIPAVAPAAPAAPAPAAPAAPTLLPTIDSAAPPAAPAAPAAAPAAAPPAAANTEWFYAEGVKATGEKPDWFKSEKYKTLGEQAKAYTELESRFGAFVGAPKDGAYKINIPEKYKGVVEVDTTNPVFTQLQDWAKKSQLSQDGYDSLIGMLSEYEALAHVPEPTVQDAMAKIGVNADARLNSVAQFVAANLDAAGKAAVASALSVNNPVIAETLTVIESLIAKSRQPAMPRPGADVPITDMVSASKAIDDLQNARDANGKRKYDTDPKYRAEVEAKRFELFRGQPAA